MGEHSASARALRQADAHDGPTSFYQVSSRAGTSIVVASHDGPLPAHYHTIEQQAADA
jgi:hypothetical protein